MVDGGGFYSYYIHQGNKLHKERKILRIKFSFMHTKRFITFFKRWILVCVGQFHVNPWFYLTAGALTCNGLGKMLQVIRLSELYNELQSAKTLLLPPKYEKIMVPSDHSFFFWSFAPCKLSLLILFASFFVSVLFFFFDGSLSKVIALPTIAIAIVVALSRS